MTQESHEQELHSVHDKVMKNTETLQDIQSTQEEILTEIRGGIGDGQDKRSIQEWIRTLRERTDKLNKHVYGIWATVTTTVIAVFGWLFGR